MKKWAKQIGFTIVELVVVISVIGILAAISVVTYRGTQDRAKSAVWVNALSDWEDVLTIYQSKKGAWPTTYGYPICLSNSYPAADGFAANECLRSIPVGNYSYTLSSGVNADISTIFTPLPQTILPVVTATNNSKLFIRGLVYQSGGNPNVTWIEYYLDKQTGANGCVKNDALEFNGYAEGTLRCRRYLQ